MARTVELDWPGHPGHGCRFEPLGDHIGMFWSDVPLYRWHAGAELWLINLAPTGQRTPDGEAEIIAPSPPLPLP